MEKKKASAFGFYCDEIVIYCGYRCRINHMYSDGGVNLTYLERYQGLSSHISGVKTEHGFYGVHPDIKKTIGNILKKI